MSNPRITREPDASETIPFAVNCPCCGRPVVVIVFPGERHFFQAAEPAWVTIVAAPGIRERVTAETPL